LLLGLLDCEEGKRGISFLNGPFRKDELGDRYWDAVKVSLSIVKSQWPTGLAFFLAFNRFGDGAGSEILGHIQKRDDQLMQSLGRQVNLAN
jgi:hypothetical protein